MPFAQELEYKHFDELDSTNDYLRSLNPIAPVTVVSADFQTKGRGQVGNVWHSDKGQNLLFSILLMPENLKATDAFVLSQAMALSIKKTLDEHLDDISVKWPNDIYWKDKKIGGILIENELEGKYIVQTIIGIGLNINQDVFHSDAPNPVSLKQILGVEVKLQEVLMKVVHGIIGGYRQLETNFDVTLQAISTLYRKHLYRREGLFPYRDAQGEFLAEYQHVELDGHLVLKDEQGTLRRYAFKEVNFIL